MTAPGVAEAPLSTRFTHPDAPLVREYLQSLAHQRHLAPVSVSNYARSLARLLELLGAARLGSLDTAQVRRSIARLHSTGLSPRALANILSAWRGLYHWLVRQKGYSANPCQGNSPIVPKPASNIIAATLPIHSYGNIRELITRWGRARQRPPGRRETRFFLC